jgi:hypothetical protein
MCRLSYLIQSFRLSAYRLSYLIQSFRLSAYRLSYLIQSFRLHLNYDCPLIHHRPNSPQSYPLSQILTLVSAKIHLRKRPCLNSAQGRTKTSRIKDWI